MKRLIANKWIRRLLILVVVVYGSDWILTSILASRNQDKIDMFTKSIGATTMFEFLDKNLGMPGGPEDNGWYAYQAALALYPKSLRDVTDDTLPVDRIPEREASLNRVHTAQELARHCPTCVPVLNYEDPLGMLLPHLHLVRSTVLAQAQSATWNLERGQTDIASQRLLDALDLSSHACREPILVSHLVELACDAIVLDVLESHMELFEDHQLSRFIEILSVDRERGRSRRSLQGEVLFALYAYERMGADSSTLDDLSGSSGPESLMLRLCPLASTWIEWDKSCYLDMMVPMASDQYSLEEWRDNFVSHEKISRFAFLTKLLLPALNNCVDKALKQEQRRQDIVARLQGELTSR